MSFDARSRERLEALGRRLPSRLPLPGDAAEAPAAAAAARSAARAPEGRHKLETEQDPEQLFRELMAASPDGNVPPHHLERLRQLEQQRQRPSSPQPVAERGSTAASAQAPSRQPAQRPADRRLQQQRPRLLDPEQQEAYTAFQQLLLEGDE